jgi:hypothetical protein
VGVTSGCVTSLVGEGDGVNLVTCQGSHRFVTIGLGNASMLP